MTKDEAMKLALEALESIEWRGFGSCWVLDNEKVESAEAALREALAQPEQEPVAWAMCLIYAEREAIAQSLDKQADLACDEIDRQWAQEMAAAVRARSNT